MKYTKELLLIKINSLNEEYKKFRKISYKDSELFKSQNFKELMNLAFELSNLIPDPPIRGKYKIIKKLFQELKWALQYKKEKLLNKLGFKNKSTPYDLERLKEIIKSKSNGS